MPKPISRQALEELYEHFFKDFLKSLQHVFQTFEEMFEEVRCPNIGIELLDNLDSELYFELIKFSHKKSLNLDLYVGIHFNQYDYECEIKLAPNLYYKCIKDNYENFPNKETQVDISNKIGRAIISKIKSEFPS